MLLQSSSLSRLTRSYQQGHVESADMTPVKQLGERACGVTGLLVSAASQLRLGDPLPEGHVMIATTKSCANRIRAIVSPRLSSAIPTTSGTSVRTYKNPVLALARYVATGPDGTPTGRAGICGAGRRPMPHPSLHIDCANAWLRKSDPLGAPIGAGISVWRADIRGGSCRATRPRCLARRWSLGGPRASWGRPSHAPRGRSRSPSREHARVSAPPVL